MSSDAISKRITTVDLNLCCVLKTSPSGLSLLDTLSSQLDLVPEHPQNGSNTSHWQYLTELEYCQAGDLGSVPEIYAEILLSTIWRSNGTNRVSYVEISCVGLQAVVRLKIAKTEDTVMLLDLMPRASKR